VQEGGLLAGVSYDDGGVASLEMHPHAHNAVATPSSIVPLSTVVSVDVSHDSTGAVVVRRGDVDGDVHFTCLTVGEAERMALTIAASVHVHRIVASRRYWRCVDVLQLVWCGVVWCGVVWCGVVWCGVSASLCRVCVVSCLLHCVVHVALSCVVLRLHCSNPSLNSAHARGNRAAGESLLLQLENYSPSRTPPLSSMNTVSGDRAACLQDVRVRSGVFYNDGVGAVCNVCRRVVCDPS
jgi:hypothetical protein